MSKKINFSLVLIKLHTGHNSPSMSVSVNLIVSTYGMHL